MSSALSSGSGTSPESLTNPALELRFHVDSRFDAVAAKRRLAVCVRRRKTQRRCPYVRKRGASSWRRLMPFESICVYRNVRVESRRDRRHAQTSLYKATTCTAQWTSRMRQTSRRPPLPHLRSNPNPPVLPPRATSHQILKSNTRLTAVRLRLNRFGECPMMSPLPQANTYMTRHCRL